MNFLLLNGPGGHSRRLLLAEYPYTTLLAGLLAPRTPQAKPGLLQLGLGAPILPPVMQLEMFFISVQ
jgi:hypothetical protein